MNLLGRNPFVRLGPFLRHPGVSITQPFRENLVAHFQRRCASPEQVSGKAQLRPALSKIEKLREAGNRLSAQDTPSSVSLAVRVRDSGRFVLCT